MADGFEESEAVVPTDILRRAGAKAVTVGVTGETVVSSHKFRIKADITKDKVILDDTLDMIVLPGGMPGTLNLEADETVQKTIDHCIKNNKYVCAICAAPSILGHKGLLKGKKATCFPGFEKDLTGAQPVDALAVTDGKIITGKGPGAAFDFGAALVTALYGKEKADTVLSQMQCR